MKTRRLSGFLLMLACLTSVPAHALEWEKNLVALTAERGADLVRTKFDFKNTGNTTVHILGITTSCSCTDATIASSTIAPGETASLQVLFTIGKLTGLQEREIEVMADDSNVATRLKLKVTIPPPVPASRPGS